MLFFNFSVVLYPCNNAIFQLYIIIYIIIFHLENVDLSVHTAADRWGFPINPP